MRRHRRALTAIGAAVALSMASAGAALADNLIVDGDGLVPVNSNAMNLGNVCADTSKSGDALLGIQRTGSGQNVYANGASVTVTAGTPSSAAVTTSFTDNGIALPGAWVSAANNTMSGDTASSSVTVSTVGATAGAKSATVAYTATGAKNGGGELSRSATLTVNWTVQICDTTPPVITPTINGTLGNNGWYTSDVDLSWSVIDAESPVSSTTGCGSVTVSADTAGDSFTCEATSAGGTASETVVIKRDTVAPSVTASASPAPNAFGWNNSAVTVSFNGTDTGSGIDACPPAVVLSSEVSNHTVDGQCDDKAGNVGTGSVGPINIDLTAPSVALDGGPASGATYPWGYVPVAPSCDGSDALSGLASCGVSGYSTAVGTHTVTATATDYAGNSNSASATYTVAPWTASGFYQPVDMLPFMNTVKNGATVPLKFQVHSGGGELTDTWVVKSLQSALMTCNSSAPIAPVEELSPTGATGLRYDAAAGHFFFNWKTPKQPGKCFQVTLNLQSGDKIVAHFRLT